MWCWSVGGECTLFCLLADKILERCADSAVRRAGLDYWEHVDLMVHDDWRAFRHHYADESRSFTDHSGTDGVKSDSAALLGTQSFFFTRQAETSIVHAGPFSSERPIYLFVGAETFGFTEEIVSDYREGGWGLELAFPMHQPDIVRCFNVATSATMALWHVYNHMAAQL